MPLLYLTDEQMSELPGLIERGMDDMDHQQSEGDLTQDGYSEDDIANFNATYNMGSELLTVIANTPRLEAALATEPKEREAIVRCVDAILTAYSHITKSEFSPDAETDVKARCIVDLFTDVMHYTNKYDIDFGELPSRAFAHFCEETA